MTKECVWRDHVGKRRVPISKFGIDNARKDGLHLYCKPCANKKTLGRRKLISEMRAAQRSARLAARIPERVTERPPEQRVLFAINEGARTQDQIKKKARILDEQLGLALVNLMLVEKKVVSRVNQVDEREYFLRSEAA